MPKDIIIRDESILGGQAPTYYLGSKSQFVVSVGVDPDIPFDFGTSIPKRSGSINPVKYDKFSSTLVNGAPLWILTSPKESDKVYTYLSSGRVVSYTAALGSETTVASLSNASGNGAAYYNNYLYFATDADVARYGPLDGTPAMTTDWWTSTASLTAPTNTTYPTSAAGVAYPNHAMHLHVDNKLYFADFINGQGLIHYIQTSKTTNEGDTNDGSSYNALDLPFGYYPTDIESWGNDLVISAIQTVDASLNQGKSALFFWDTFSDSFYKQVDILETYTTALLNNRGHLFVFSGSTSKLVISEFVGGFEVRPLYANEDSMAVLPGAVDSVGARILWGNRTDYPVTSASVFAMGYNRPELPREAVHNIIQTDATTSGNNIGVTALKLHKHDQNVNEYVVGWNSDSGNELTKLATAGTRNSVIRMPIQHISQPFQIKKIRIHLTTTVDANVTITPKIFLDDESSSSTLDVINNTNFSGERNIDLYPNQVQGEFNYFLELTFTGTKIASVVLPITYIVSLLDQ